MKKKIFCLVFLSMIYTGNIFARMESDNYIIWGDVFSSGGSEDSSSANYHLQDTIGEAVVFSATSTSENYGTKAGFREMYPDQYLTFSIVDADIDLGILSSTATGVGSNKMIIATNASNGFIITVSGSTLSSGSNTIESIGASASASNIGTEQFGINLVENSNPAIGADPSGISPIGSAASQYNFSNFFAFNSGDTIVSSISGINLTTFTVSYIANISSETESGNYTTTLVYSATASF